MLGKDLATLRRCWTTQPYPSPSLINSHTLGLSPETIISSLSEPQRPHLGNEHRQLGSINSLWRPGIVHTGMPPKQVRQVPGQRQLTLPLPPRRAQDGEEVNRLQDRPWSSHISDYASQPDRLLGQGNQAGHRTRLGQVRTSPELSAGSESLSMSKGLAEGTAGMATASGRSREPRAQVCRGHIVGREGTRET